ncbi:MAG: lytic murein transglycosylase B [Gammaproteobacteria bacterium]|nr:lytic murein transglycosylase B [Gammaproteobacteria bacterium]
MHKAISFALLLLAFPLTAPANDYASRPEAREFARELAGESNFAEVELLSILAQAEYQQGVIDSISRPAERELTWAEYQDIFLTQERTAAGVEFMSEHRAALTQAHERYGAPPEVVAAIIGVETFYGRITGDYRVLDSLATLTFDYPPRAGFFRGQLKQFIRLARQEEMEITSLKGSYAGAMGLGQFIPSSFLNYAVDFDGDGFRDIWNNPVDAIGSVANYLKEHGWERDAGIALRVEAAGVPREVFNVSLEPGISIAELEASGMIAELGNLDREQWVTPMRLVGKRGDEFWLGMRNFYVITRYNHSELYAMAVYQLSESLKKAVTPSDR